MNKYCIMIIKYLYEKNFVTPVFSCNGNTIFKEKMTNISTSTFSRACKSLLDNGYIAEGVKDGRYKQYYLTESGINFLCKSTADVNKVQVLKNK